MKLKVTFLRENTLPTHLRTQLSCPIPATCVCWRNRSYAAESLGFPSNPGYSDFMISLGRFHPPAQHWVGGLEAHKAGPQLMQNWWHPIKRQSPPSPVLCQIPLTGNVTEPLQPGPRVSCWQTLPHPLPLPAWEATISMAGSGNLSSAPSLPTHSP